MGGMGIDNIWTAADRQNAVNLWIASRGWTNRQVIFKKFAGWETEDSVNRDETLRRAKFDDRAESVWLSQIRVFDTVKGGYFTTGDLDINSVFEIIGHRATYNLPNGVEVPEYAGDQIVWNGKLWVVADQIEPVQFGILGDAVFWKTVMRRVDATGQPGVGP